MGPLNPQGPGSGFRDGFRLYRAWDWVSTVSGFRRGSGARRAKEVGFGSGDFRFGVSDARLGMIRLKKLIRASGLSIGALVFSYIGLLALGFRIPALFVFGCESF